MRSYDLLATVRAANVPSLAAGQTLIIDLEGGATINDGAGGFFYWNASSTAADDGGISTIKPTAAGSSGRYLRLTNPAGIAGSFTVTLVGVSGTVTTTVYYVLSGGPALGVVTASVIAGTGTSNSTSFSLSGWPTSLRGATLVVDSPSVPSQDNTVLGSTCYMSIPPVSGNCIITLNNTSGLWTGSGIKGFSAFSFSYILR